ncbi:MAG: DUF4118 domain-containing protein [Terriglobales bacterium]
MALLLCASAAWATTLVPWDRQARMIVPFAFLGIVLLLGCIFGRTVGVLGSVIAAGVFARCMYEPLGSLRVHDEAARGAVAWMLLTGVTVSWLLLPLRGPAVTRRSDKQD